MNILNEQYNLTSQGFIYSEGNDDIYKFFVVNENEILLSFKEDNKGRLTEMNFVADNKFYEDLSSFEFFKNSLNAFINNENTYREIVDHNNSEDILKTDTKETVTIKSGNIEVLLDVTTLGTVITVYKDI
jgi:predicted acetyltransferase